MKQLIIITLIGIFCCGCGTTIKDTIQDVVDNANDTIDIIREPIQDAQEASDRIGL